MYTADFVCPQLTEKEVEGPGERHEVMKCHI